VRSKILVNIITLLLITSTYADETIIPKNIYDDYLINNKNYGKENFSLRKFFKVNLTNSGNDEYIAFYYIPEKNKNDESLYECIKVYIIKGNKIIKNYRIEHVSYMDYNTVEDELKTIKELEKYFGPWNGYFYTYDLNGNGIPELFLYDLSGIGGSFGIYEYNREKDRFETILGGGELYNYAKMVIDKETKAFIIYAHYEPKGDYPAHVLHYAEIEYKWNEKNKRYESRTLRKGLTYEDVQKITK